VTYERVCAVRGVSLLSPLRYFIDFAFGVVLFTFSLFWCKRSLKAAS
jgi:hypothetical protein